MALQSTSPTHARGFTLIEIVLVMGIMVALALLATYFGMESYRGFLFRSERDMLVSALQHARAQALQNTCFGTGCTGGRPHGVFVAPSGDAFTIFEGASYAARDTNVDAVLDANAYITKTGWSEVVFEPLSGDVADAGTLTVSDGLSRTSVITIGEEGQITWSN